jgi:hypothetical protein
MGSSNRGRCSLHRPDWRMTTNMRKPSVGQKKRGRPPADNPLLLLSFRTSVNQAARLDQWAGKQDDKPDRSEAIRRLIDLGLLVGWPSTRAHSPQSRATAADMAGETLDQHADQLAAPEAQARRKRRLLKRAEGIPPDAQAPQVTIKDRGPKQRNTTALQKGGSH